MDHSAFKKKLAAKELLIGSIVSLASPEVAEIYSRSGLDWLWVDLEHGALSILEAQRLLQAASPNAPCLIRVPVNGETWIKKALDIGPAGVIVPRVNTADEARTAVWWSKYPPQGNRSVGIARAHGFGPDFQSYIDTANDATAVVIQIEHIDAVTNIEEIVRVPGIDALIIGPYDMSASMGKIGRPNDPEVLAAVAKVKKQADQAEIPIGVFGATPEAVRPYIDQGYTLIAVGADVMHLSEAAAKIAGGLRRS